MRRVRCAIYTRKSSEQGLEQDFNSLDAQREACEAYVASQKHEGWELLPDYYDDGGISGGHLDRPALQRLMQAVDEKRVDQIVVYKIDRMTRSLADFAKLVERLGVAEASFVSVTQSFNTATSMGRLTLNVLLSFAQFEREVTAERIRDKIAASKRKGLWMGGNVPLGYKADGRSLKIDEGEAATIRTLYELYLGCGTVRAVKERADALGLKSRLRERAGGRVSGGGQFDRGHIQHILSNPIYAGRIRHKVQVFEGQHPAIIEPPVWDQVQQLLAGGAAKARGKKHIGLRSPLAGKMFDETGDRLTPTHSKKNGRRLRYYISRRLVTDRSRAHPDAWRLPAEELEALLTDCIRSRFTRPDTALFFIQDASATEILRASDQVAGIKTTKGYLALIKRVDIKPGSLTLMLDRHAIAQTLECQPARIDTAALTIHSSYRMRRRGVELKLHLGDVPPEIDKTLAQNVVKAQRWLRMIIEGKTFSQIATQAGVSKRRVQDVVDLALLAPEVLDAIASGDQPDGFTTDYLIKSGFPASWSDQRQQFAEL